MKNKYYIFFNRKGVISISILLIFVIIASIFSILIYSSVEATEGYIFRNNLDYAVLSAGSTMSTGIELYYNLTTIRSTLFLLSQIMFIVSIFSPETLPTIIEIINKIKDISAFIGKIQHLIPATYALLSIIYGMKNFKENNKNLNAVIIPNVVINYFGELKEQNKEFNFSDLLNYLTDPKNFEDIFKSGFTGIGIRKKNILEKIRNIFNVKKRTILDDYEIFINSCEVTKQTPNQYAFIDLSVAVRLDEILKNIWESKNVTELDGYETYIEGGKNKLIEIKNCIINQIRPKDCTNCNKYNGCKIYNSLDSLACASKIKTNNCPDVKISIKIDEYIGALNNFISKCVNMIKECEDNIKNYQSKIEEEKKKENPNYNLINSYLDLINKETQKKNELENKKSLAETAINYLKELKGIINSDYPENKNWMIYGLDLFRELQSTEMNETITKRAGELYSYLDYAQSQSVLIINKTNGIINLIGQINDEDIKYISDELGEYLSYPKDFFKEVGSVIDNINILKNDTETYKRNLKNFVKNNYLNSFLEIFLCYNYSDTEDCSLSNLIQAVSSLFLEKKELSNIKIKDEYKELNNSVNSESKVELNDETLNNIKTIIMCFPEYMSSLSNIFTMKTNLYAYYSPKLVIDLPKEYIISLYKKVANNNLFYLDSYIENLDENIINDLNNFKENLKDFLFNNINQFLVSKENNFIFSEELLNKKISINENNEITFRDLMESSSDNIKNIIDVKGLVYLFGKYLIVGITGGIIKSIVTCGTFALKEIIEKAIVSTIKGVVIVIITKAIENLIDNIFKNFIEKIDNETQSMNLSSYFNQLSNIFNNNSVLRDYILEFKYLPITSISYNKPIFDYYFPYRRLRLCLKKASFR